MLKNYNLLFIFPFFLVTFVLVPQLVLAVDYTGCTDPLEYCLIKVGEELTISQNIPGFVCAKVDERWITNKGNIDIFVPIKNCVEYANWRIHVTGLMNKGFYVRLPVCYGKTDGQQDESCNGVCRVCMSEKCVSATQCTGRYYASGNFVSTNLLSGVSPAPTSIDSFVYYLFAKPANTDAKIQFSRDNSNWYNSSGVLGGTNTLTTGVYNYNTINLSNLNWSGANFYYKVIFTSDGANTPVLDSIKLNYTF